MAARISKHQGEASLAQRPPLESAELQAALGFRLRVAWGAMERYFFECFQAENIAPATYAILVLVAANPGCPRGGNLRGHRHQLREHHSVHR